VVNLLVFVVANQQTVVELIGFFQRAFPPSPSVKSSVNRQTDQSEPLVIEVRIVVLFHATAFMRKIIANIDYFFSFV